MESEELLTFIPELLYLLQEVLSVCSTCMEYHETVVNCNFFRQLVTLVKGRGLFSVIFRDTTPVGTHILRDIADEGMYYC
jgi:hypothetical protein